MSTAPKPKGAWRQSKAKQQLKMGILVGRITNDTDLRELHQSDDEYKQWPWTQFRTNTKSLIKSCNDPTKGNKVKWAGSVGRELLKQDIIAGTVHDLSDPEVVHSSRDEYKMFPLASFKTNMENLLEIIIASFERMQDDIEAYGHDMALIRERRRNNPTIPTPWHRSPCKASMEKDIAELKHKTIDPDTNKRITPKKFHQSRDEYKAYSLKVFRKHIYQEIDRIGKQEYRMEKKKSRARNRPKPPADIDFQIAANAPS